MGRFRFAGKLRDRVRAIIVEATTGTEKMKVAPKQRRHSGPLLVPSDNWMDAEYQRLLGPQCVECHQNLVRGQHLVDGKWCSQCAPRRRVVNGDDLPPAA